jgi:predicted Zn-dependent protease
LIQLEEPEACIPRLEVLTADSPHNDVLQGALGYVYAVTGQDRRANELLDVMTNPGKSGRIHEPYAIALDLIGLNQRQQAVQRLEQSYREGSFWSLGFLSDPILAPLRNDPHYRQFLSKVSYPVAENAGPSLGFAG